MSTVAEIKPVGTLSFHQALDMAEVLARNALPIAQHERISCAVALVKTGAVLETDTPHLWEVASTSTPGKVYSVNGACACEDAHYRAPHGQCKHVLAVLLARRTLTLMQGPPAPLAQPEPPAPMPTPGPTVEPEPVAAVACSLPEAPVSITLKASFDGQDVLVTLRGTDFASVKAQVEEASVWLKAHAATTTRMADATPQCPTHRAAKRSGKGAGWYCPKKLPDGTFCTWKGVPA